MLRRTDLLRPRALVALVAVVAVLNGCSATAGPGVSPPLTATAPAEVTPLRYVAMGDSYTAAPLNPLDERSEIDSCLRSSDNYPRLVAHSLDINVIDVSCSGASTTSMFREQRFSGTSKPPQLDALTTETDLVTVGIGANDFRFFYNMIFTCLELAASDPQGAPCRESNKIASGGIRLERQLLEIERNVARVVRAIGNRAPDAQVLLVGYPQLLPNEGTCTPKLPLALGDYAFTRELNLQLADAVQAGGVRAGAEYVDLVAASQGHDICSAQPWVAGVRGDPSRAMGLHPYPAEQRAVADLVLDLV